MLGSGDAKINGVFINQATYYVVAMASFGVITATYTNIAISVTFQREAGILKRTRGTPLPGWAYLTARVSHALFVSFILVIITMAFGVAFYSAHVPSGIGLIEFLVTLIVGGLTFCALALALTSIIPNADASPAIVNATIFPLLFLSGIFIPILDSSPEWIKVIGRIFPVKHFTDAMRAGFLSDVTARTPLGTSESVPVPLVGRRHRGPVGRRGARPRDALLQLGAPEVGRCARLRARAGVVCGPPSLQVNEGVRRCGSS